MKKHIVTFVLLLSTLAMYGQVTDLRPFLIEEEVEQDSIPPTIIVEQADNQILDATTQDTILYLNGNVRLFHDSTYMYCDTAQMIGQNVNAFGDVAIVKSDSLRVFADSIYYDGLIQKAYLYHNVVLEDKENQLFTQSLLYNLKDDYAVYADTALLRTKEYDIKSKRGIYYAKYGYADFAENVSVEGDKTRILTDSMRFYNKEQKIVFKAPSRIDLEDMKIYSESGYYNLETGMALFEGNGQLVTENETIEADRIEYDEVKDIAIFSGNAIIRNDTETGTADFITYDRANKKLTLTGNARFVKNEDVGTADTIVFDDGNSLLTLTGNARYVTPDQTIEGNVIEYETKTEILRVEDEGYLSMPPLLVWSGDIDYDPVLDVAKFRKNVIVKDTASGYTLHGDFVDYDKGEDNVLAYNSKGKPWVESITEKDTLYMSGDTLRYITLPRMGMDTLKMLKAYKNVEFLNKDVSGISDTLSYNRTDSLITLVGEAMLWRDSTQLAAEHIDIQMANDSPKHIKLRDKALIMNTPDMKYYNQLAGDAADVYFKEDNIDNIKIKGNANTLYYIQDKDKSYIGVDKTNATALSIFFDKKEITFLKYYGDVKSEVLPMKGTDHNSIKLDGAVWEYGVRPKEQSDLLD